MLPPRTQPRLPATCISLALLLAWCGGPAAAQKVLPDAKAAVPLLEQWLVVELDGKRCGYESNITTQDDTASGTQYKTVTETVFVVKRLGMTLRMDDVSTIVEDADGAVLSFQSVTSDPGSRVETNGLREGDELVVSSHGQTQRYKLPRLAALGPEAIERLTEKLPLKIGQTFSFNAFIPQYPQGAVIEKGTIVGHEDHPVRGKVLKLWKMTSEMSVMPGFIVTTWEDDDSTDVESVQPIPGIGELHEYASTRAECMRQPDAPEVFATSLIAPQMALPDPKLQAQAVYRLDTADIEHKLNLWNGGEQRVLSSEPGTSEIEVTVPLTKPADATYSLPHADTPDLHKYLKASSYLEADAPLIRKLSRQAVGDEKNPVRAAAKIEHFVRDYITKKDLNVGFASAEETAESREGDCTEHAVLCAALGRAAGLPTRCVLGLGYLPPGESNPTISNAIDPTNGFFGFHMWAEAMIAPDQWVAMDAALGPFDVGHIAILKTALEDVNPLVDINLPILQLLQNLKIEIVKTVSKADYVPPAPPPAAPTATNISPTAPINPPTPSTTTPVPPSKPSPPPGKPGID